MVPFRLTTRREAEYVVVTVDGAVDTLTAQAYGQRLIDAFAESSRVICDISMVDFFDSAGLGALVDARNHAVVTGGSLELVCTNVSMLKLFSITGLDGLFIVHRSIADVTDKVAARA